MEKITYLIGAGASTGYDDKKRVLPILNGLPKEFENISQEIKRWASNGLSRSKIISVFDSDVMFNNAINEFQESLYELSILSIKYGSIDTYARRVNKFDDGDSPSYRKTLSTYAAFFILIENGYLAPSKLDNRYINFLSNILSYEEGSPFRQNIDVLSWNYDSQFETALKIVQGKNYNSITNSFIKLHPKKYTSIHDSSNFLIKLNGEAQFIINETDNYIVEKFEDLGTKDNNDLALLNLLKVWYNSFNDENIYNTGLSFSWDLEKNNKFFDLIKSRSKNTNALVIIGYSLPFFNRRIDRDLILNMNPKRIYIQDKYVDNIVNRLEHLCGERFVKEKLATATSNVDSFVLPIEL